MRPTIALALIALTAPLAGCDLAERLEGKSPGREHMERLALLEAQFAARNSPPAAAPEPVAVAPVELAAVQPVIVPPEPAPVVVAPPPEPAAPAVCVAIFRVLSCDDEGKEVWL